MPWQVRLGGAWKDVDAADTKQLERHYEAGETLFQISSRGQKYEIDLRSELWAQKNIATGKSRNIRIWPPPATEAAEDLSNYAGSNEPLTRDGTVLGGAVAVAEFKSLQTLQIYVWRNGDWAPVSQAQDRQIKEHLGNGEKVFQITEGSFCFEIDTTGKDGWIQRGKTRSRRMKYEETSIDGTLDPSSSTSSSSASPSRKPSRRPYQTEASGLIPSLRQEWREVSEGKRTIGQKDVEVIWRKKISAASDEDGKPAKSASRVLDSVEVELLKQASMDMFNKMDISQNGNIEESEWLHYRLLENMAPSFYALAQVNEKLMEWHMDSEFLMRFIKLFEDHGAAGEDPRLDAEQMKRAAKVWVDKLVSNVDKSTKAWIDKWKLQSKVSDVQTYLRKVQSGDPEVIEEDDSFTYYDFMNHLLGRKKEQVELFLYDISNGKAKMLSPCLLCHYIEGIWHSGVVLYGKEYWFGGRIFESTPGTTPFGTPSKKIPLKEKTMRSKQDIWNFVQRELVNEFTRENYEVLTHNCNHFSDALIQYILNEHIPNDVLNQQEPIMNTCTVQLIRPLLNRWLGGFGDDDSGTSSTGRSSEAEDMWGEWSALTDGTLVLFEYEPGWTCIARLVCKEGDNTCKLQWLDIKKRRFRETGAVPRVEVSPLHRADTRSAKTKAHKTGGVFSACLRDTRDKRAG